MLIFYNPQELTQFFKLFEIFIIKKLDEIFGNNLKFIALKIEIINYQFQL